MVKSSLTVLGVHLDGRLTTRKLGPEGVLGDDPGFVLVPLFRLNWDYEADDDYGDSDPRTPHDPSATIASGVLHSHLQHRTIPPYSENGCE